MSMIISFKKDDPEIDHFKMITKYKKMGAAYKKIQEEEDTAFKIKDTFPLMAKVKDKVMHKKKDLIERMKAEITDADRFDLIVNFRSNLEKMSADSVQKTEKHFNLVFALHKQFTIYPCDICGRNYNAEILSHHQTLCFDFACDQCHETFPDKRNLIIHKSSTHELKNYQCAICETSFNQKSTLMTHIAMDHEEGTVLKCDFCAKQFSHKEMLWKHVEATHKFKGSRHNLEEFEDISKTIEECKCNACGKTFHSNKELAIHHSQVYRIIQKFPMHFILDYTIKRKTMWGNIQGEKKFKCDKCPKMFSRRGSLVRHIAERKGELQYQCEHCEKMFSVKKGLEYHIDTRHLNQDLSMPMEPPEGKEAPATENEDFGQISMKVKYKGPTMSEIKNLP